MSRAAVRDARAFNGGQQSDADQADGGTNPYDAEKKRHA
jgi:hypothetical protein